jgi:hypothetical protein
MTEEIIAIFAWLGGACFCGIIPIGFAAILYFSARKRGRIGTAVGAAKKCAIAGLHLGPDLVRVEGKIQPLDGAIDGASHNALVYLRLKVEVYSRDSDSSGWKGFLDKNRAIPFQLGDGSESIWIQPEGLDKQLLGDGIVPTNEQIEVACILLDISPKMLRGQLRYFLWEMRAGQTLTVIGGVGAGTNGMELIKIQNQPFIISPYLGQAVDGKISTQSKLAKVWMFVLGIPGLLFLLCGLGGAVISLVRMMVK